MKWYVLREKTGPRHYWGPFDDSRCATGAWVRDRSKAWRYTRAEAYSAAEHIEATVVRLVRRKADVAIDRAAEAARGAWWEALGGKPGKLDDGEANAWRAAACAATSSASCGESHAVMAEDLKRAETKADRLVEDIIRLTEEMNVALAEVTKERKIANEHLAARHDAEARLRDIGLLGKKIRESLERCGL